MPVTTIIMPVESRSSWMPMRRWKSPMVAQSNAASPGFPEQQEGNHQRRHGGRGGQQRHDRALSQHELIHRRDDEREEEEDPGEIHGRGKRI
jgi:hypothetical protein